MLRKPTSLFKNWSDFLIVNLDALAISERFDEAFCLSMIFVFRSDIFDAIFCVSGRPKKICLRSLPLMAISDFQISRDVSKYLICLSSGNFIQIHSHLLCTDGVLHFDLINFK